jgi:NAD(P)-dependent dehydrogenase (short-subunit alcohol dehydrogenase family)
VNTQPEDVADGIVFLCTDEAKFISGAALDIQAGGNARNMT